MAEQTLPVTLTLKRSTVEALERSDGQHWQGLIESLIDRLSPSLAGEGRGQVRAHQAQAAEKRRRERSA